MQFWLIPYIKFFGKVSNAFDNNIEIKNEADAYLIECYMRNAQNEKAEDLFKQSFGQSESFFKDLGSLIIKLYSNDLLSGYEA